MDIEPKHSQLKSLLTPAARREQFDEVERLFSSPKRGYPVSRALGRLLAVLIIRLPITSVLEYGAGLSSLIATTCFDLIGGGKLTSVENKPEYCQSFWKKIIEHAHTDALLVVSPLGPAEVAGRKLNMYSNADSMLADRAPFDLVLIDGPEGKYGREGTLYQAWNYLDDGAVVILDDFGRDSENIALRNWLSAYPELYPILIDASFGRRGIAVLQRSNKSISSGLAYPAPDKADSIVTKRRMKE